MSTVNLERLQKPFTFARNEFGDIDLRDDAELRRLYEPLKAKHGGLARIPMSLKNAVVSRLHEEAEDLQDRNPHLTYKDAIMRIGSRKPWLLYFTLLYNYADNDQGLDVEIQYEEPGK